MSVYQFPVDMKDATFGIRGSNGKDLFRFKYKEPKKEYLKEPIIIDDARQELFNMMIMPLIFKGSNRSVTFIEGIFKNGIRTMSQLETYLGMVEKHGRCFVCEINNTDLYQILNISEKDFKDKIKEEV